MGAAARRRAACEAAGRPRGSRAPGAPPRPTGARSGRSPGARGAGRQGCSAPPWRCRRARHRAARGRSRCRGRGRCRPGRARARARWRPTDASAGCSCPRCAATGRPAAVGAQVSSEVNSWRAHSDLPWVARSTPIRLRSSPEHLDVEGGVAQPRLGQRPGRPVDRGVLLGQAQPEVVLDHHGETDPRQPEDAARRSVSNSCRGRRPTSARHARSWVAACRIHSAAPIASSSGEVGAADRVDEPGARALATHLHEVGALAVAVARGPLGVDRHRPLTGGHGGGRRASPRSVSMTTGTPSAGSLAAPPLAAERPRWREPLSRNAFSAEVREGDHAVRQRRQPGDGAQQVRPGAQVRRPRRRRGPRGPDLDLDAGRAVGQAAKLSDTTRVTVPPSRV